MASEALLRKQTGEAVAGRHAVAVDAPSPAVALRPPAANRDDTATPACRHGASSSRGPHCYGSCIRV